jgi:uncharacterized protein YbjT (DUF2867 family)
MPETILVVGATGVLGGPIAHRLALDGFKVRVMSRSLDRLKKFDSNQFEAVQGDVENVESLSKALKGCTGVYISIQSDSGDWDFERRGAENVSRVASEQGVKRISIISGASTCKENAWFPMTKAKLEAENALKASAIPYTIFRCTMFMDSLPSWVHSNKIYIIGDQPTKWHWIASKDYASMVSKAFSIDEAANKTFYIRGPEAWSFKEAFHIYASTGNKNVKVAKIPFWFARILSWMPGNVMLRKVGLPIFQYFSMVSEMGDPTEANTLLGEPTTTLQAWSEASSE